MKIGTAMDLTRRCVFTRTSAGALVGGCGQLDPARDTFGRGIDYLRISVTDRCNERCLYCAPEGYRGWERNPDHLSADEIVRVVRVAAGLGFRKFRLTGGEPLVRGDLVDIVRQVAALPGVDCVGMSTNGIRLSASAEILRRAGLRTVNISLDALDPQVYSRITGGNVTLVMEGIRAALAAGFERVKLNTVLMRGLNEQEIWPLVRFAAECACSPAVHRAHARNADWCA